MTFNDLIFTKLIVCQYTFMDIFCSIFIHIERNM